MDRELWLFTTRFPQGSSEPFLENELPVLARRFQRVRIFPLLKEAGMRALPDGVEVLHLFDDPYRSASAPALVRHLPLLRSVLFEVRRSAPDRALYLKHRREVLSRLRQALRRMRILVRTMAGRFHPDRVVLYSYWTADWATVLGLWKAIDPRVRFITRMHGFDLYAERSVDGWPPFRSFHLRQVDRVFAASQAGLDHLLAQHPAYRGKFQLGHLGTNDHGAGPWSPSPVLRIASCSNLVQLKRVHLIAEALRQVTVPVEWTHFGDGPERDRIEEIIARMPGNVKAHLAGNRANADLMTWYREHPVDLFIHVSESEGGVPVALQEAASFGIPLMACDAGGVKEIVDDRTGILLPPDPTTRQIAQLAQEHPVSHRNTAAFRAGVRTAWRARYRAEEVFGTFADQLLQG